MYCSILFLASFLLCRTIELDISSDFKMDIEFRLEKLGTEWSKRGTLSFLEKGSKNYKSAIEIKNEIMSNDIIQNINKECELQGNYFIRFRSSKNIFYSTINPVYTNHNNIV